MANESNKAKAAMTRNMIAWVPIVIFPLVIGILYRLDIKVTAQPHLLMELLNLSFCVPAAFLASYIAARSYAIKGNRHLIFLGSGMLAWGLAAGLIAVVGGDINAQLTVHDIGMCLAGALSLCAALFASGQGRSGNLRAGGSDIAISITYVGVGIFMLLIGWACSHQVLAPFFIPGYGLTLLHQFIIGVASAEFLIAALMFWLLQARSRNFFYHWYSLGLFLLGVGLLGVWLAMPGTPLDWAARCAQFFAGPYILASIFSVRRHLGEGISSLEQDLRQSEAHLKLAQICSGAGVWDWDIATGKLEWSEELFRLFGLDPEKTGASFDIWRSMLYPEDCLAAEGRIKEAIDSRVPLNNEYRIVLSSGIIRWINALGNTIYDNSGKPLRMSGICIDVTERKRLEAQIIDVAGKYSTLFNSTSDGVWINDLSGRIREVNDAYCRMSGYSRDELIHMPISQIEAAEDAEDISERIKKIIEAGGHDRFDSRHRRKDSSVFDVEITALYMQRDGGRIAGFVRDISERKKLQHLLQSKSRELEAILDTAPAMIFYKDKENRYLRVNKALEEAMGLSREQLEGKSMFELYPKEQADAFWADDLEVLRAGQAKRGIIELMDSPQGERILETDKIPYFDEAGNITGVVGFAIDVTERKCAEEVLKRDKQATELLAREQASQLVKAQMELEKARRLADIGVLAATVAHELRNPLAAIGLAAYNIKNKVKDPAVDKHLLNINKKVAESEQIINNLLFYSRLKPPHCETVNIYELIEECIDIFIKQNKMRLGVIKELGSIKDIMIEADPLQMREVVTNILNNANDAVLPRKGRIGIAAESDDGFVRVLIEDNGMGIGTDIIEKVFDPFFTTKAKGTGLGLSVCRQIINMHQGLIEIESELGKGTRVIFRLPKKAKRMLA